MEVFQMTSLAKEVSNVTNIRDTKEEISITIHYTGLSEPRIPDTYEYLSPSTKETFLLPLVTETYSDGVITDRTATIEAVIDYGLQSYIPKPLSTVKVDYYDKGTSKNIVANVAFSKLEQLQDFYWCDDVVAYSVFEVYDAAFYRLKNSDIYIPYNDINQKLPGMSKK